MLTRILCLILGYAFGLIQTGYIVGKLQGVDIRNHGSGNSGATNTLRVLGTKSGLLVFFLDALKCIFAVIITYFLFATKQPELYMLIKFYTAFGVILGHNFPFYLKFKGGKGISATAGLIITMGPWYLLVNLIIFALIFGTTHYVSLGSLSLYAALFIETVIAGCAGWFNKGDVIISQPVLIEMYILMLIMTVMAYVRHKKNILRLINHEESKVYLIKKNKDNNN